MVRATAGKVLRQLFAERPPVALIGCPSAMVGREVVRAGFPAAYVSGYVTALNAGMPDIGLIPREDMSKRIRELSSATGVPVVADADTGFGEPEAMYMTVHEYARAGAGGFHIEDQVFPKRCGHLEGKQVVPVKDFVTKIQAAAAARETSSDPDFVIIARSDAKQVEGLTSMIDRCKAYVEAGADALFPEATSTVQEFKEFAESMRDVRTPSGNAPFLVANMTEYGKTQRITMQEFASVGYNAVIYPVSMLRVQQYAARALCEAIHRDGHTGHGPNMQTQSEELALARYTTGVEWRFPQSGWQDPEGTAMPNAWPGWEEGNFGQNPNARPQK